MVRVGFVVEGGDFDIAGGSIQADRFVERPVRFESDGLDAVPSGAVLELAQESTANSKTTRGHGDPHASDIRRLVAVELERPATDRVPMKRGHQKEAGGRPHLSRVSGNAHRRIEAVVEPAVEFGEI